MQLPKDPFVLQIPLQLLQPRLLRLQPSQLRLRLQATLRPLPTAVQQLLSHRLLRLRQLQAELLLQHRAVVQQLRGLLVLLPPVLQLLRLFPQVLLRAVLQLPRRL